MIIRIVTDEEIKNAYNSYTNGLSVEKVSKLFNIPQTSLRRYFKRKGYSIRSLSEAEKIYSFNESYFDNIDTSDKAYWLGFLYADGYILSKRKHGNRKFGVTLSVADIEHLEKLKQCLNSNHRIAIYHSKNSYNANCEYCRLLFSSQHAVDSLKKYGVIENKTNILKPPNISNDLSRHFIRGYFDGDGSIWSHLNKKYGAKIPQYSIEFVGTDCILQYIMDNLLEHKIIKRLYNLNKRKKGQIVSNFKFGGNLQALNFCQYIYQDANTYLDRKHDKYIELTTIHSCL